MNVVAQSFRARPVAARAAAVNSAWHDRGAMQPDPVVRPPSR